MTEKQLTEIVCEAWNKLDVSIIEPYLAESFEYESFWVLETMKGKGTYLDYLTGKYNAIRRSGSIVKASLLYQAQIGKYVVHTEQDGNEGAIELFVNDGMIEKMWIRPLELMLPTVFHSKEPE